MVDAVVGTGCGVILRRWWTWLFVPVVATTTVRCGDSIGTGSASNCGEILKVMGASKAAVHVVVALAHVVRFYWFLACFLLAVV